LLKIRIQNNIDKMTKAYDKKFPRLKSIDIFRGLCMAWMVLNHLIDWWLKPKYSWLHGVVIMIIDPIGASGFLFISGVSVSLSYRSRLDRAKDSEDYNNRMLNYTYLFRALFLLIIALIYNSIIALLILNPSMIWTWFVLLTAAISLFLAWPLLKTSKMVRLFIVTGLLFINQLILTWLLPYKGTFNLYGVLFHFLYHDINQDPILLFFPFFLVGTVVGDIIFDTFSYINEKDHKQNFVRRLFLPLNLGGIILIIIGISFKTPEFLMRESFSWQIYSLGIILLIMSILLFFDEFELVKTKRSYKFLFYYSYYSLTIYLAHNLLYFLFLKQLNIFNVWFFAAGAFIMIGIILRTIYKTWGGSASIKVQIGRLSLGLTQKIEKRIRNTINKK